MKKLIALLSLVALVGFAADYTPASQEAAAQVDTEATTTATAYTPKFVGQVLIGQDGVGTNAVWIAKGVTTNDWVKVK